MIIIVPRNRPPMRRCARRSTRTARRSTRCSRRSTPIFAGRVSSMRDDASRARLVEMGFELYVPRGLQAVAAERAGSRKRVALIARDESASSRSLLAQVVRALAFARIDAVVASEPTRIGDVAGMVVFGASLARETS